MALPFNELESITDDYYMLEDGKAVDIYFDSSFLLNYLMKQQKGLYKRPSGGRRIKVPLLYDGQEAQFYSKGDTLSSDDRNALISAYFDWKHAYGNATVYRIDDLTNAGDEGKVELVTSRIYGAQMSLTKLLAGSLFDDHGGSNERLTGLRALCSETAGTAYGGIEEEDLEASDGTKPWEGKTTTTSAPEAISLSVVRTLATSAKIRDGKNGKPDIGVMPETLWNSLVDQLQVQQRFKEGVETAKAGFVGLSFEGKEIYPDDYCPSGYMFLVNTTHLGFAIHKKGNMTRTTWRIIPDSPDDKTMKIYFDGNMICNNRKGHAAHSNLIA